MSETESVCEFWIEENNKLHQRIDELEKQNQKLQIRLSMKEDIVRIKTKE